MNEKIEKYISNKGLPMCKMIVAPSYGIFYSQSGIYDRRTGYSWKEVSKLSKEGYMADTDKVDLGAFVINALMQED